MAALELPEWPIQGAGVRNSPRAAIAISNHLRRLIVWMGKAGDTLPPERVLVERFDVSRPTIREALRVLEVEGLLEIRRGLHGGAIVRDLDIADLSQTFGVFLQRQRVLLSDVYDYRLIVEPQAAGALALRPAAAGKLRHALDLEAESLRAISPAATSECLNAFHDLILQLTGNDVLASVGRLLSAVIRQHSELMLDTQPLAERQRWAEESHHAHERIAGAILAGQQEAAERAMRRHLGAIRASADGSRRQTVQVIARPDAPLQPDTIGLRPA